MAALAIVAAAIYWPVVDLPPFESDNVYVLAWSSATPASGVLAVDPFFYPEWRPIAYATVWIQQRLLDSIPLQFIVNLALWVACAWLVFRITLRLGGASGAMVAALLVISDPRATWALVAIVERQTSLACLFGLGALWMVIAFESLVPPRVQVALTAMLIASMLSKEYGAAFAAGLGLFGAIERRRDLWQPALLSIALYAVLRVAVTGGVSQPYCEEMYFFGIAREVCLGADPSSLAQMAYNAAATLVNLPLLGLLSGSGEPIFAESRLVTGVVFTALAIAGVVRGPRVARALALVVIANALLSLVIYRDRNQLAGACALAALAGIGITPASMLIRSRTARVAAAALAIALIGAQAVLSHALVVERRAEAAAIDPCDLDIMSRDFVPPYVAALKTQYGLPDPRCRDRD